MLGHPLHKFDGSKAVNTLFGELENIPGDQDFH